MDEWFKSITPGAFQSRIERPAIQVSRSPQETALNCLRVPLWKRSSSMKEKPRPEPSLRVIARLAGVSPTAVSMALRDSVRISKATRKRIKRIADQQGYRPDPAITRLMLHVRTRRTRRLIKGTICALMATGWGNVERGYSKIVVDAARLHADALGFAFDIVSIEEITARRGRMTRILRNRGVDGLLLAPLPAPMVLPTDLGWDEFSIVAASYSILKPDFHRVVPHQFDNMLLLCDQLQRRGFRRVGLILEAAYEERVHHCASAAVSWQSLFGGTEFVRPLIVDRFHGVSIDKWMGNEKPDVVIVSDKERADELESILTASSAPRPAIVCGSWAPGQRFAGVDERPNEIGTRAIDILASMILHNQKGIPSVPTVTMVSGNFISDGLP
jgi:hypothetical protein